MSNVERAEKEVIADITEILKNESIPQEVRNKLDKKILEYGRDMYDKGVDDGFDKGIDRGFELGIERMSDYPDL